MKKIYWLLISLLLLIPINTKALENIDLYLFHSSTCEHCKAEIEYLNSIQDEYPNLNIHLYEVTERTDESKANAKVMSNVGSKMNIKHVQTPFTILGNTYYIGFEGSIQDSLGKLIASESEEPSVNVVEKIFNDEDISDIEIKNGKIDQIDTPFGKIDPNKVSIPVLAVIIGFIDGFNPCAMWVLIFLISMLFNMKNRKRMWALGITFLTASALVYMLFMLAWIEVIKDFSQIQWFRLIIALVALIGGIVNLRSFYKGLKKDDGCEVVDENKRKKMFARIKKITTEKSFILAMIGVIFLAVSVNVIELACSAGLPLIFTQILTLNELSGIEYMINVLIYIFFFLIDDIVVFTIAMVTLSVTGISTKYTKYSHLVGGIIMVIIAILMAFKPEWLMFNI